MQHFCWFVWLLCLPVFTQPVVVLYFFGNLTVSCTFTSELRLPAASFPRNSARHLRLTFGMKVAFPRCLTHRWNSLSVRPFTISAWILRVNWGFHSEWGSVCPQEWWSVPSLFLTQQNLRWGFCAAASRDLSFWFSWPWRCRLQQSRSGHPLLVFLPWGQRLWHAHGPWVCDILKLQLKLTSFSKYSGDKSKK